MISEIPIDFANEKIGSEKSYELGAGSGAMSCLDGHCGELVINDNLTTGVSKSIIAQVGKNKECVSNEYSERKHGGLGNIFFNFVKSCIINWIKFNNCYRRMLTPAYTRYFLNPYSPFIIII